MKKTNNHKKQSKILKKKNKDKQRLNQYKRDKLSIKDIEKKTAQSLASIEKLLNKIPSSCHICNSAFNTKNNDHLDKWNMTFNGYRVVLTCDSCLENMSGEGINTC